MRLMGYLNGMQIKSAKERFWKHVTKKDGGCWLWIGAINHNGYGTYRDDEKRAVRAHRFSFQIANGEIPNGMRILHKCDVPNCVNPSHLFLGTDLDNVRDAQAKGRFKVAKVPIGMRHPSAKLTDSDVISMRKIHSDGKLGFRSLSRLFGVSKVAAKNAILRKTWKHVA